MLSKIIEQDQEAYKEMCTRWVDNPLGGLMQTKECDKMDKGICSAYSRPYTLFRSGGCALCSIPSEVIAKDQKKVNALKASKRAVRGG
jgi:hypothetical protein